MTSFKNVKLMAKGQPQAIDLSLPDVDYSNLTTLYEVEAFAKTVLEGKAQEHPAMPWELSMAVMEVMDKARQAANICFPMDARTVQQLRNDVKNIT